MRFQKWHGIGNAYLVVERANVPLELTAARVERICHPDLGAGSDGILVLDPAGDGQTRVTILNPDGSEAEFSGNGTRIAAGYLMRRDGVDELTMATLKGEIRARRLGEEIEIDAGHASLDGPDHRPGAGAPPAERYTFVSVGNPHCVVEVDDPDVLDLRAVGEPIERHGWFPNRTNVEFYRPVEEHEIRVRVWERGAGETLSSGSCSTAAAVAAVVNGQASSPVTARMDGGSLRIDVADDLAIRLTGPVEQVHEGRFHGDFLTTLEGLI